MPRNYSEWHPRDHKDFRLLRGPQPLTEGSIAHAEEMIGRFPLGFTFVVTRVVPNERLEWKAILPYSLIGLQGSFAIARIGDREADLIAVTRYGSAMPIVGILLDAVANLIVDKKLVAEHMREEGLNLKDAVEKKLYERKEVSAQALDA